MSFSLTPAARRRYLRRCIGISVTRRWTWVVGAGGLALGLAWALLGTGWGAALGGMLGASATALGIALDSCRRHRAEV